MTDTLTATPARPLGPEDLTAGLAGVIAGLRAEIDHTVARLAESSPDLDPHRALGPNGRPLLADLHTALANAYAALVTVEYVTPDRASVGATLAPPPAARAADHHAQAAPVTDRAGLALLTEVATRGRTTRTGSGEAVAIPADLFGRIQGHVQQAQGAARG